MIKLLIFILSFWTLIQSQLLNNYTDITNFIKDQIYPRSTFNFTFINGYVKVGKLDYPKTNTALFFSLFTKINETIDNISPKTPLIFWFDGGPGCSSQYDFWGSVGALDYDEEADRIVERAVTWNKDAMMVFIDQPVGTLWSYTDSEKFNTSTTYQASFIFLEFLATFYEWFPRLTVLKTYIFGESYAGHYVPCFAERLMKNNIWGIDLRGIGIGNGWIDPFIQTLAYGTTYFSVGIVSQGDYNQVLGQQNLAAGLYFKDDLYQASKMTDNITNLTNSQIGGYMEAYGGVSIYDFQDYYRTDQVGEGYVKLFKNATFRRGYGIPDYVPEFEDCNSSVSDNFVVDNAISYKYSLEYLLSTGKVNVLIYNGQLDLVCNTAGVVNVVNQLKWNKLQEWQGAQKQVWKYPSQQTVGNFKQSGNLCLAVVYDAGHLVPEDQPEVAYDMLQKFLDWNWNSP